MDLADIRELKVMVERQVRPVRAKLARKMAMRENLLSTVVPAYEARIAQGESRRRALEHCSRLLGDPGEAAARLQRSVPWLESVAYRGDRYLLDLAIGRRSAPLASFRGIGFFVLLVWVSASVLFVLVNTLLWFDGLARFPAGAGTWLLVSAGSSLYLLFYLRLLMFLADSLWKAFCRLPVPDWPRVVLVLVAASFFLPSFYFGVRFFETRGNFLTTLHDVLDRFPAGALVVPYSLLTFVKVARRLVDGPMGEDWRRRVARDFAWAVPLLLVVFVTASVLSRDVAIGAENAGCILVLALAWLAPFTVAWSRPTQMRLFRACLEWEQLPLEHRPS